jgi:two-component system cell cycle response regulator DivK
MAGEALLIIDDNEINLKVERLALQAGGYEVRTARNAEEALSVLASFKPILILVDIQLPGMDGLTLTKQLKAEPKTKDIVIVAMTAYAMKGDEERALTAGCDSYIPKPIDTRKLPGEVETLIRKYFNRNRNQ